MFRGDEILGVVDGIVKFLRDIFEDTSAEHAVIGLSGGVDSAVVFKLLLKALGSERILALALPEITTPRNALKDALKLAKSYGVKTIKKSITPMMLASGAYFKIEALATVSPRLNRWMKQKFETDIIKEDVYLHTLRTKKNKWVARETSLYRMKHRIRMIMLYYFAERTNGIVIGTANRSEYLTGFFVKHGDGAADVMPIIELYKTEVFELAQVLDVPTSIVKRSPSPDLIPGVTDEYALSIDYATLDLILAGLIDRRLKPEEVAQEVGTSVEMVNRVKTIVEMSAPMRISYLSPKFGRGQSC